MNKAHQYMTGHLGKKGQVQVTIDRFLLAVALGPLALSSPSAAVLDGTKARLSLHHVSRAGDFTGVTPEGTEYRPARVRRAASPNVCFGLWSCSNLCYVAGGRPKQTDANERTCWAHVDEQLWCGLVGRLHGRRLDSMEA